MVHLLYIGHFEHERDWVRFEPARPRHFEASKPVVTRPVEAATIEKIVRELDPKYGLAPLLEGKTPLPNADGFLVFDQYDLSEADVAFIDRLVRTAGCEIYDVSHGQFLKPSDLQVRKPRAIRDRG